MTMLRLQMDIWSAEWAIDRKNSPAQLLMNLFLPESLKIPPKESNSRRNTAAIEAGAGGDIPGGLN